MSQEDDNIRVLCGLAVDRLKSQIGRVDGIDNKVGIVFGLSNGLVVALLVFLATLPKPLHVPVYILSSSSLVAYIVTLWLLLRAYRISRWDYRPNLLDLRELCADPQYHGHGDVIGEWVADECVTAYNYNEPRLANKARAASQSIIALGIQGVLFALAGGVAVLIH